MNLESISRSERNPKPLRGLHIIKRSTRNVHIVLIPGFGSSPWESWFVSLSSWRSCLSELDYGISVHSYDHSIPHDDQFSWQHLLDEGLPLLSALQAFIDNLEEPQPILLVCHGLGGVILKQALCIANNYFDRYSRLLLSMGGVMFLGTPHRLEGVDYRQFGERVICILKPEGVAGSISRQGLSRLKETCSMLEELASRFERVNLRVDVLSVYEKIPTRIKDPGTLRSRTKKLIIVDKNLCAISMTTEQCIGVDLDHIQLPSLCPVGGGPVEPVKLWLTSIINSSHDNIGNQFFRDRARRGNSPSSSSNTSVDSLGFEGARQALSIQVHNTVLSSDSERHTSTQVEVGSSSQAEILSLLEEFSIKQIDPRIPCFMVDTFVRNTGFFGREEVLKQLDSCLLPSDDLMVSAQPDRIRVGLLCGMGGLGKTETAIEYAYSRQHLFDAVFFIHAEDTSKLESDIAQIAVRLGIQDANEPDDKIVNRGLAIEWLCNPFKKEHVAGRSIARPASWLIIFDNADEPDILAPYRDITNSGAVLITSRSPLAKTSFSHQTVNVDIQPFNPAEGAEFVQAVTGIDGHIDEAREIGERLGGLPLALAQMAGIIRLEFLSYSEFLDLYNDTDEAPDIHDTVLQPLRTTARGSLSTIWAIERFSKSARVIIEISSFLNPDCIQESILTDHAASIQLPDFPKKKGQFFAARKQLIGSSLFRHNQDTAEYWMHRVTQDVVRAKIEPERRIAIFSEVISIITSAWPAANVGGHDVKLWDILEKLYPHVTSLRDLYGLYFEPKHDDVDMAFASLLTRAGWYQHERGESHSLLPVLHLALDLCNHIKTIDTRDLESDIRYTLGAVANETNDAASCVLHTKRFLEIRLEIAKETQSTDERLARSYNQMGVAWMMVREYEKAKHDFTMSAQLYEKIPNYTKDKRSLSLVNLGLAHWLQGDLEEAMKVLRLGLQDREELYGYMDMHSFRTGRFLHALGNVLFSQGSIKESEEFHMRALKQYQSTIRNRHHRTADVCHKVAQHCLRKGEFEEASKLVDHGLKVWNADVNTYAPEIARTTYLKAKILFAAGQEDEATRLFKIATSSRRKITGDLTRKDKDLNEDHFDELVAFWSR